METIPHDPTSADSIPQLTDSVDVDALLKEAKQRERRRRFTVAGVAIVLAAGGVLWGISSAGGFAGGSTIGEHMPSGATPFAETAISSTTRAVTAQFSYIYGHTSMGGCIPASNAPTTSGAGEINFAKSDVSITQRTSGCQDLDHAASSTLWREVDGTMYLTFPSNLNGIPTSPSKPWLAVPPKDTNSFVTATLSGVMTSSAPLRILHALRGTVRRLGNTNVKGVLTTEYVGHASLASFYTPAVVGKNDRKVMIGSGPWVPAANKIPIQMHIWIDSSGQIAEIQAGEPLYTGIYTDGSDEEGAEQVSTLDTEGGGPGFTLPNGRVIPPAPIKHLKLRTLRQQSEVKVTVDFTNFASPVNISPPPNSRLTRYKGTPS